MLIIYVNCALGSFVSPEYIIWGFAHHWTESASKGISSGEAQETNRNMQIAVKGEEPWPVADGSPRTPTFSLQTSINYSMEVSTWVPGTSTKIQVTLIPPKPSWVCAHEVLGVDHQNNPLNTTIFNSLSNIKSETLSW
jgi:hypothetical protein